MVTANVIDALQTVYPGYEPYRVRVEEVVRFREKGFLVVSNLVPLADVQMLIDHTDNLLAGRETLPTVQPPPDDFSPEEKLQYYVRIHMLHRVSPLHERFLLHPRVLDVLEVLIGPDVLALQTMLFFKQPGQQGQGYHQDAYYIPSFPETLCGAWLAVDPATIENGCLWFTDGTQFEPIYPDSDGVTSNGDRMITDIDRIFGASVTDESKNGLTRIAQKYPGREVPVEAAPGAVVFFNGHIIHRSHENRSKTMSRRSFVAHYCNARSFVPWNHGEPYEGASANGQHILARGDTHMPYAQPKFGTPCAANAPELRIRQAPNKPSSPMPNDNGLMILTAHGDPAHD